MRKKISDYAQYEKDTFNKSVLNVDNASLNSYKKQREKMKLVFNSTNDIENLKLDVQEIKSLLHQLINNK